MPKKDQEPREPATRPPAYPLDEALEEAYAPPHVGHTDDDEYREGAAGKAPWEQGYTKTTGGNHQASTTGGNDGREGADGNDRRGMAGEGNGKEHSSEGNAAEDDLSWIVGEEHEEEQKETSLVNQGTKPVVTSLARASNTVPETLHQKLAKLPRWQARYVLELRALGGIQALACKRCNVSAESVEDAQEASPAFRKACAIAANHSTDLVEAAVFRGATIGDLDPIYQGGALVGYRRRRNTKDAELFLRLRGRLGEDRESARGAIMAAQITAEALPGAVAGVLERLYGANKGRPVIEAEVIEVK